MREQTLEQRRAADALRQIKVLENAPEAGAYARYVKALSASILMNGLGQALAFEKMKGTPEGNDAGGHKKLYEHVSKWLCRVGGPLAAPEADALLQITRVDRATYMRAQAEALAYLAWLKKLAGAFLKSEEP
jgi:CRISPR-associated protein Cmr5